MHPFFEECASTYVHPVVIKDQKQTGEVSLFRKDILKCFLKLLSVVFLICSAVTSAFLDSLTVSAVVVGVCSGLLGVYYHVVKTRSLPEISRKAELQEKPFALFPKTSKTPQRVKRTNSEVTRLLMVGEEVATGEELPNEFPDYVQGTHGRPGRRTSSVWGSSVSYHMPKLKIIMNEEVRRPSLVEDGEELSEEQQQIEFEMGRFRAFLRSLVMHAAAGTALGGIVTKVGEPHNLLIADRLGWDFTEFMLKMSPIWGVAFALGTVVCVAVETFQKFGYGTQLPTACRKVLQEFAVSEYGRMETKEFANLSIQCLGAFALVIGLILQVAEVGILGLAVIIVVTTFNGLIVEREIAIAFQDAMPFVSLLIVFFGIVAILDEQETFVPVVDAVLELEESTQPAVMYAANGVLSAVSDNVFVATIFINQIVAAKNAVNSTISDEQFERLGLSVVAGVNVPSMATPNGRSATLFILTSNLAPIVGLSYRKMTLMALPYFTVLTVGGLLSLVYLT